MKVFLDMDGVLVDFQKGVNQILGLAIDHYWGVVQWNWLTKHGFTNDDLFRAVRTKDFWVNLDWMPDGRALFEVITKWWKAPYLVTIPISESRGEYGKQKWVESNLPERFWNRLIIMGWGTSKALLARDSNCLLIDDKEENCEAFIRAGGSAILVPRPWNYRRPLAHFTPEVVETELVEWIDQRKER